MAAPPFSLMDAPPWFAWVLLVLVLAVSTPYFLALYREHKREQGEVQKQARQARRAQQAEHRSGPPPT